MSYSPLCPPICGTYTALPNDAKLVGYRPRANNPFEFDAIYKSEAKGFTGSEGDFVDKSLAYRYVQLDCGTRRIVEGQFIEPLL